MMTSKKAKPRGRDSQLYPSNTNEAFFSEVMASVHQWGQKKPNQKIESYNATTSLANRGYINVRKLTNTLQGGVYRATFKASNSSVVIKRTNKIFHEEGQGVVDGRLLQVHENIVNEKNILMSLQRMNPPQGFLKVYDFYQDQKNYWLIMQHGGMSLLKYVSNCHQLIQNGKLKLEEYQNSVRISFKVMVKFVDWLHETATCCHRDISLENLLIHKPVINISTGKYLSHGDIYFCDYGLASFFTPNNASFSQIVGKISYRSPEVSEKVQFDGKKNDVWSLGICLFTMLSNKKPLNEATKYDKNFKKIINGNVNKMCIDVGIEKFFTKSAMDLLAKILVWESKRISTKNILKHHYLS